MSKFNKDSYQVLENNFRSHKECLNNIFWPKSFTTNTLCINVYKMYECDKNQMPCYNVIIF